MTTPRRTTRTLRQTGWVAAALLVSVAPAHAQRQVLETDDLSLVFARATQGYLAPHVARCFQNSLAFHRRLWDYRPTERMTVVLNDFSDSGNAAAGAVPRDFVMLETSPLSLAYETVAPNERMNWLLNHELVHVTAMDQAAAGDRFFRGLFAGKVTPIAAHPESILYFFLTAPRAAAPRWYQEGIAVFIETWMAGGLGRAQGAWDEMVFRAKVRDGSRIYDPLGLAAEGTTVDFQVGVNDYLYGTRFMTWLALRYTPEQLLSWVSRKDGTKRYYSAAFEQVFGQSLDQAWQEWIEWERGFQEANLAAIREHPITPSTDISDRALGSVSRAYLDAERGKLYAAFNYPGVVGYVGAIDLEDGSVEHIADVKQPSIFTVTALAFDPVGRTLFFTNDNHAYRDLMAVDPDTGDVRTLIEDARVGELVFDRSERSLWGIRHFNGIASLVRIPEPWTSWQRVRSWPYGEVMYDLDVSPDGRLLSASYGDVSGHHALRVWSVEKLLADDAEPLASVSLDPALPLNFVFSPDGRYLFGSSYYTGVSNIFRWDFSSGDLQALTNTETGFFRPLPLGGDELIVFRYSGDGFVPARIRATPLEDVNPIRFLGQQLVEEHPVVREWQVGSPADVPLDSLLTGEGDYRSLSRIALESVYPVVTGYKDTTAFGLRLNMSDPAFLNRVGASVSFTPGSELEGWERLHVDADFERFDWTASARFNGADFYDLFGPTRRSRKGYAFALGHVNTLVFDEPRHMELSVDAALHGNLEQLPSAQNVTVDVKTLVQASARLEYSNLRHSLGHVDEEKGHRWELALSGDLVQGRIYPKLRADGDVGWALGIPHSSIWLRSSAGISTEDPDSPFSNFYFGGFGNNWVDFRDEKRYREHYSLPGAELDEVAGRNYVKSMLEWNLPPLRFRRVGNSAFYLRWARPAVFASTLLTDLDDPGRRQLVGSAGAQLDLRFNLLSRLEMTFSVGHGVAWQDGFAPRRETMVSLKVLR